MYGGDRFRWLEQSRKKLRPDEKLDRHTKRETTVKHLHSKLEMRDTKVL